MYGCVGASAPEVPEPKRPRLTVNGGQSESNLGRSTSGMQSSRQQSPRVVPSAPNGYSAENNEYLKSRPKRQVPPARKILELYLLWRQAKP